MASIKFKDIPETSLPEIEEGRKTLIVIDCVDTVTRSGYKALVMTFENVNLPHFQVKFENFIYGTQEKDFDFSNKAVAFGTQKLKKLNEATVNLDDLDIKAFSKLIVNQVVDADVVLEENSKGNKYPRINGTNFYKTQKAEAEPIDTITEPQDDEDPFIGM